MYDLFKIKYANDKLSYESYRNIFNTSFNISFGYPRTDTCSKCDEFKIKIDAIKIELSFNSECTKPEQQLHELELLKEQHHKDAEIFYVRKRNARFKAQREYKFEAIAFDFQKNLNLPNQSTNDFYYKRKLAFYSFNIHVLSSNEVYLYCYDETIAKKGADEVTSMLYDFFIKHLDKEIRSVELFCDSCAGQNKNYTLIRFMDFLVHEKKRFDFIKVTFPERGHSFMECDKDMGLINCKTPTSDPSDWIKTFKNARKNPTPFHVIELTQGMVKSITDFFRPFYKNKCPIPTRPLREICFRGDSSGIVFHRDSWNGLLLKTNLKNNRKNTINSEIPILYNAKLCISVAKYRDLQVLKRFTSNAQFYDSLPYNQEVIETFHENIDSENEE